MYLAGQYRPLLLARTMFEKGFLPAPGAWTEQPYHWIQALEVIDAQVAQVERERIERLKSRDTTEL